jgi:IS5 family transposase
LTKPVELITTRCGSGQNLKDWSYAQTEHSVGDSQVLRQFCRLGLDPVPHHTTLVPWSNLLQPESMHRLLDRVTQLGRSLMVTHGRKLRIDSTVVASAIDLPQTPPVWPCTAHSGVRSATRHSQTCPVDVPAASH